MLKWCKNIFVNKSDKYKINQIIFMTCRFVMARHEKNVIHDSTIQNLKIYINSK